MNNEQKKQRCLNYFYDIAWKLRETHEMIGSCNHDFSIYLVPKGTADKLSYISKPENSYRISDHWNWYANTKKCQDPYYVQCYNRDLPRARDRKGEGLPSDPVKAICVAYTSDGQEYTTIFGEKFNKKKVHWEFVNR